VGRGVDGNDAMAYNMMMMMMMQVTQVFEKHKGEGIMGVVNLMGDYHYCAMDDLEDTDIMTMMQVCYVTCYGLVEQETCDSCAVLVLGCCLLHQVCQVFVSSVFCFAASIHRVYDCCSC
jgi:hypothetical protein